VAGQWKIEDHRTAGGQSRFRQFIDGLTREERADAVVLLDGMMKKRDDIPHLVMTRLRKLQKEVN